jgi:hypothetical protein
MACLAVWIRNVARRYAALRIDDAVSSVGCDGISQLK